MNWEDSESAKLRKLSLHYRMQATECKKLEVLLSSYFSLGQVTLEPIGKCVWPVFCASVNNKIWSFVKVAPKENNQRTIDFTLAAGECVLIPKVLHNKPIEFDFRSILCTEWRDCERLPAEEMTESETLSFLNGIERLSHAMQNAKDVLDADGRDSPSRQFDIIVAWAKRHPSMYWLIKPLTSIPAAEREYGQRRLLTIHGDMHMKNYGFTNGRFSTVFDFDTLVKGLPCEDVAYAFTERMRKSEMRHERKQRLLRNFRLVVEKSQWPVNEWRIAINHARLRIASRRLLKHPQNPLVALDVARRDRELRPLLEVLS